MKFMNTYAAGVAVMALFAGATVLAASKAEIDASVSTALKSFHALNPANKELQQKAAGLLVFMTQDALDKFMNSKGWSIGADTGIALIKTGAAGDYDTQTLKKPIVGLVFGEKGLIADLSLEGSKINSIDR